jgi:FKBP-type peptidyl-prolyl cis-trans isomerase FkpA
MKQLSIFFVLLMVIGFSSCKKDDSLSESEQLVEDVKLIENYLSDHNLTAEKTNSGLHYIISDPGTGGHPNINSTVTVQYTGKLLDGTEFDSGTATFPLRNVIKGWQEGIPLFKLKGRGKLLIPSYIGYGPSGSNSIPPNAVLVFDIYLISFN